MELKIFLTGNRSGSAASLESGAEVLDRRIERSDLIAALGDKEKRDQVLCYVCGPAAMTDAFVKLLREVQGMDANKVLCEKWW